MGCGVEDGFTVGVNEGDVEVGLEWLGTVNEEELDE